MTAENTKHQTRNTQHPMDGIRALVPRWASSIIVFLIFAFTAFAEDLTTAFSNANKLYEQQKFSEAAVAYEKLIQSGQISTPLYFNLGNAYFKAGQTGRAIAAYRKAEGLSPRDPDLKANLQFARDQVQNSKPPKSTLWTAFLGRLTLNEWAILTAVVVWLWFLLLALGQWRRDLARMLRGYAITLAVVSISLIICTASAMEKHSIKSAVVITQEAVVRKGPFEESQSAFSLRDGAEVTILDKKEIWLQVADTANRLGWVPETQVELVR